jgi:glucosamine kinase
MKLRIGIDGGGTKTECVLVDETGSVVEIHVGAASNPSVVGAEQAKSIVTAALNSLRAQAAAHTGNSENPVSDTLLCMAGSRSFWQEFSGELKGFGRVSAVDDSLPVLELATHGRPGIVLHSGTGSFVVARSSDGSVNYAGGLGWRLGDPGSGHDIGRRAAARAVLDLQGWAPSSRLAALLREKTGLPDAAGITRFFHHDPSSGKLLAALAADVLRLADEDDQVAKQIVIQSTSELLDIAVRVAEELFTSTLLDTIPAGISGPILVHPIVRKALAARSPLQLLPVEGTPIEGVRRMLAAMK